MESVRHAKIDKQNKFDSWSGYIKKIVLNLKFWLNFVFYWDINPN